MRVKKGSVLCVDDEPNILRSLHWMLHKDFDVMTAPDGYAALEMLRKHDFDVIVSDQRMPGMIGSEFLREACKLAPRAMRILLTGYSDMQAILRSINEGEVFRFVNKPWSNEELSTTVAEAAAIAKTQPVPAPAGPLEAIAIDETLDSILVLDEDPGLAGVVKQSTSPNVRITHASSMAEAVAVLGSEAVSVVVSDTRVGRMDTTPLLKVLKQRHPNIVSVVLTSDSDVDSVIKLINQGQVYRFIPKPVKPAFLKIMLASAVHKHRELRSTPGMERRHAVQPAPAGTEAKLVKAVQEEAMRLKPMAQAGSASVLGRLGGGLKKLFGIG